MSTHASGVTKNAKSSRLKMGQNDFMACSGLSRRGVSSAKTSSSVPCSRAPRTRGRRGPRATSAATARSVAFIASRRASCFHVQRSVAVSSPRIRRSTFANTSQRARACVSAFAASPRTTSVERRASVACVAISSIVPSATSLPLRDDERARAARLDLAQDVRREEHRVLLAELAEELAHVADLVRVEARGGLVEDEERRVRRRARPRGRRAGGSPSRGCR